MDQIPKDALSIEIFDMYAAPIMEKLLINQIVKTFLLKLNKLEDRKLL